MYKGMIYVGELKKYVDYKGEKTRINVPWGTGTLFSGDLRMRADGVFSNGYANGHVDIQWKDGDEWHGEYMDGNPWNGQGKAMNGKTGVWRQGQKIL